jgi:hypothetical protein
LQGSARWAALGLIVLTACAAGEAQVSSAPLSSVATGGPDASDLPGLPRAALPGYVVHVSTLDAAGLSADALDPSSLAAILAGAKFEVGREGRFTSRAKPLTMVVARVLRFRSSAGALGYLDWLRTHGRDLLGTKTQVTDPPEVADAIAFSHDPCISCAKDTFWYFAAWTRGPYAITFRAGGPHAGLATAAPLVAALDAHVRTEG